MSENLIYGTDICAYGAVGDGKTDCSEAFEKAINNGESLICVPFGTYLITRPFEITSSTKLHIHPSAKICYNPKDKNAASFIYAKDSSSIEICGGIFNIADKVKCTVFSFDKCENIRISNCSLNTPDCKETVFFNASEDININNVIFNGMSDGIVLTDECKNVTVKDITVKAAGNVIGFGKGGKMCDCENINIRNASVLFCDSFIELLLGNAKNINVENISARFSFAFAKLFEKFDLCDSSFENIEAFIVDTGANEGKTKAYFTFASCPDGFEIRGFRRNSERESTPFVPTFILKNTNSDKAKLIIDGIALDNVICARGKSKTVQMTTAKLSNPFGKFIYTLEIGVNKDDMFYVPLGDFDYLSANKA